MNRAVEPDLRRHYTQGLGGVLGDVGEELRRGSPRSDPSLRPVADLEAAAAAVAIALTAEEDRS